MGEWVEIEASTCTTNGSEIRECSNCDYSEIDEIEALGHSYEFAVTAPTCTGQGYTTYTCLCGDTYVDSYVDEMEHTPSDWIIDLAPEPNVEGSMHKECTACHEILETDVIEALPEVNEFKTEMVQILIVLLLLVILTFVTIIIVRKKKHA
jgi:hypothetical protein